MREEAGNLFAVKADAIVIATNWTTKQNGDAVMGAGVAKQAAQRWRWLPTFLGDVIRHHQIAVHAIRSEDGPHIVALPTKRDWRNPSDLALIGTMVQQLVWFATEYGWQTVALPRLGCGHGGLDWAVQVRPLLAEILDDRFIVVHPVAGSQEPVR